MVPLFLKWEVEYHHILFQSWDQAKATIFSSNLPQLRCIIPGDTVVRENEPPKGKKLPADKSQTSNEFNDAS